MIRKHITQTNLFSQFTLPILYYKVEDLPETYEEAVELFKLAGQGDADAKLKLGYLYSEGEIYSNNKGFRQNYPQALKLFRESADKGNVSALYLIGRLYAQGEDYQEALKWYRLAAELGSMHARSILSVMCASGDKTQSDYEEAVKWNKLLDDQGGSVLVKNLLITVDDGIKFSQNILGWMYYTGYGVRQDYEQALKWYLLAAKQGIAVAQNDLALMYYYGEGVSQDYQEAYAWVCLAARNLDNNFLELKNAIACELDAGSLAKAQKRSENILKMIQKKTKK